MNHPALALGGGNLFQGRRGVLRDKVVIAKGKAWEAAREGNDRRGGGVPVSALRGFQVYLALGKLSGSMTGGVVFVPPGLSLRHPSIYPQGELYI